MAHVLWKGAISFGLLHAPVMLYSASRQSDIDFDWLERGTLQPVGYLRVVKETGKEVGKDDIVKGIKQKNGRYVVLSDEEIKAANVKSTHTIDIVSFTDSQNLSFPYFEAPYFVVPEKGGEKVYTLLREALLAAKKVGIALVVLHNKQHLAALVPTSRVIILNTLRWATEVKDADELDLPAEGIGPAAIKPKELEMATQLIENMSEDWKPAQYRDTFSDDIMELVRKKIKEGKAGEISDIKFEVPEEKPVTVADLTELLKQSLQGAARHPARKGAPARQTSLPAKRGSHPRGRVSKTVH